MNDRTAIPPTFTDVTSRCYAIAKQLGYTHPDIHFNTTAEHGGPVVDVHVFVDDQHAVGPFMAIIVALENAQHNGKTLARAVSDAGFTWRPHSSASVPE